MTRLGDHSVAWVQPQFLLKGGPRGLLKVLERLLMLLNFDDVRVIDGSGDLGADILAVRDNEVWVFQAKWKASGTVDASAVNEAFNAAGVYRADRVVVVTNSKLSRPAHVRAREIARLGCEVTIWNGATLEEISVGISRRPPDNFALRDYQKEAVKAADSAIQNGNRALVMLATGLGKTVVGGELIRLQFEKNPNSRVLVLSHLRELSAQLEKALWKHLPAQVPTSLLTGETKPESLNGVLSATVESALQLISDGYRPDLIMIDEAHHVGERGSYRKVLAKCGGVPFFGLTATPWRGDQFDVTDVFGEAKYKLGIAEGMAQGFLSKVNYRLFVDNIDWSGVDLKSKYGYSLKELNSKLFVEERDERIVEELHSVWNSTSEPRGIVFCQTIQHAERIAKLLTYRTPAWEGASAIHSELSMQRRQLILHGFRIGKVPILTCVDVLNEGVDVPDVNIVAFLKVTHSRRIFIQQLGRGLRLAPGKSELKVLDFVTDLRRVAAALDLKKQLRHEVEFLALEDDFSENIAFSDETTGTLFDHWLSDTADLDASADDSRLQFPDNFGIH